MAQRLVLVTIGFLASVASWAALQTFLLVSATSDVPVDLERTVAQALLIVVTVLIPVFVIAGIAVIFDWDWDPDVEMSPPEV